jgi:molybdopterin/thiamine biosynthesis adenylyltransferase
MAIWLFLGLMLLGWLFRLPGRIIALGMACLWLGILGAHLVAPESAIAGWIGGSARGWLVVGALAALILAYRAVLGWLRGRAKPGKMTMTDPAEKNRTGSDGLSDAELDRYARHLVLREIGGPGQMRLRDARVLIVGAGGLGAPVCLYLAAAGVGRITLADDDVVSLSNLQRQVIFRTDQQGQPKAEAAGAAMVALNPHVAVIPLPRRITGDDAALIAEHDLVIDGSDSFPSRAGVNVACVAAGAPLLAGAIAQWEGQVTLYDPKRGGPCLHCLFPEAPAQGLAPACAEAGVVGALPGVVGSIMALEAIKHLTGAGQGLRGRMMLYDGLYGETRVIGTNARKGCEICGAE